LSVISGVGFATQVLLSDHYNSSLQFQENGKRNIKTSKFSTIEPEGYVSLAI
jgi:hypothetical protein